jgi:hypothetical protein
MSMSQALCLGDSTSCAGSASDDDAPKMQAIITHVAKLAVLII